MPDNQRWIWLGLIYGCALFAFAIVDSGFGHGTYLPFGIYGAPVSIVPIVGIFVPPLWWGLLGSPMEDGTERWTHFSKIERAMPVWLWSGMALYVVGQLVAWTVTLRPSAVKRS